MMARVLSRKLRPPLKYHGGKHYLARRIIALMPAHRVYVEPYFGGGSVLLNKDPSPVEVASDIDARLVDFWTTLRDHPRRLAEALKDVRYSRESFEEWKDWLTDLEATSPVDTAAQYLIISRMSRGGLGEDFAWSDRLRGKRRPGGPVPGDLNAWDTARAGLPSVAARIRHVEFSQGHATSLIARHDAHDAVIYCDPPYLHETRTVKRSYGHEMTRRDHDEMLGMLLGCRGTVMLSGYRSDLYDSRLAGWARHEFDLPNHSGQGAAKQRRIECLWINKELRR